MSINYNSYHLESNPDRKTRKQLERYKKTVENLPEFIFNYSSMPLDIFQIDWDEL